MKHLFIGIGFVTLLTTLQALPATNSVTTQTVIDQEATRQAYSKMLAESGPIALGIIVTKQVQTVAPVVVTNQTLRLWWTPSPDTNSTGTFIYGTTNVSDFADINAPTNFILVQDAGMASVIVMTNVTPATQWYWTATAHDASGAQSVHCNVLSTWIPNPPQNIQPVPPVK